MTLSSPGSCILAEVGPDKDKLWAQAPGYKAWHCRPHSKPGSTVAKRFDGGLDRGMRGKGIGDPSPLTCSDNIELVNTHSF